MASPFAVVPSPAKLNPDSHLLFFLATTTQQLAMEVRLISQAQPYIQYANNGVPQGIINNPSALAAAVLNGAVRRAFWHKPDLVFKSSVPTKG